MVGQLRGGQGPHGGGGDADILVCHGVEDVRQPAVVLVLQDTQQQNPPLVREVAQQVLRHGLGALGVVPAIDHKERLVRQKLEAAGPADGVEPVLHVGLLQFPAFLAQHIHHLQYSGGIFQLVRAQQRQGVSLALVGEALAVEGVKLAVDLGKVRDNEGGALLLAALPHHVCHAFRLLEEYHRTAVFDDARFFKRDLLHRVAQHGGVVQPDVHDHRARGRRDDIGGVEAAAETHLQHHHVAFFLRVPQQSHRGHQLKLRGVIGHGLRRGLDAGDKLGQDLVVDLLAVDLHALIEAVEIGGGVEPGFVTGGLEYRSGHGCAAALAVGAGDVDKLQSLLGIAQLFQQLPDALQPRLGAEKFHAADIRERFLNIHNRSVSPLSCWPHSSIFYAPRQEQVVPRPDFLQSAARHRIMGYPIGKEGVDACSARNTCPWPWSWPGRRRPTARCRWAA